MTASFLFFFASFVALCLLLLLTLLWWTETIKTLEKALEGWEDSLGFCQKLLDALAEAEKNMSRKDAFINAYGRYQSKQEGKAATKRKG